MTQPGRVYGAEVDAVAPAAVEPSDAKLAIAVTTDFRKGALAPGRPSVALQAGGLRYRVVDIVTIGEAI